MRIKRSLIFQFLARAGTDLAFLKQGQTSLVLVGKGTNRKSMNYVENVAAFIQFHIFAIFFYKTQKKILIPIDIVGNKRYLHIH